MLVTIKTLQHSNFTVEIEPSQTVLTLKEKIEAVKGAEFPAKGIRLMYAGKILLDNNRVSDYNIEEKKFVIGVLKPMPKKAVIKEEVVDLLDEQFLNTSTGSDLADPARVAQHDRLVRHIAELGFTREQVELALRACFNNANRAVEYLITGAIAHATSSVTRTTRFPELSDENLIRHIADGTPRPINSIIPSQERIFELFSEAVEECQNHNRALDRMVEADHERITQSYARLEAAGITNPLGPLGEGLANLNNTFDHATAMAGCYPSGTEMFDVFTDAFTGGFGMGASLMDCDHEAIERLKQLGFSDHQVIEAYFVCERNEVAAADFLLTRKNQ